MGKGRSPTAGCPVDRRWPMDEVLARSGIFQGVDPEAAEALAKEMENVEIRKSEVIFNEGEPGDSLYIVLSGKIKLGRRAADGLLLSPHRRSP